MTKIRVYIATWSTEKLSDIKTITLFNIEKIIEERNQIRFIDIKDNELFDCSSDDLVKIEVG